tara:strand:+ start:662 stop:916 length:255 start_codon:yes stop_codon:yes gene_type:complete
MIDEFKSTQPSMGGPAARHSLVVPSDTEDLPRRPRALYINTDGTVALQLRGVTETYNVLAGSILPVRPERILQTGTTAAIIAWE